MAKKNTKLTTTIRVHPELFKDFKEVCKENYKSISESIRDLMQKYIKDNRQKNKG